MVSWKQTLGVIVFVVFILVMIIIYSPIVDGPDEMDKGDELTGAYSFRQYFSTREPVSLFQEEVTKCIYDTTCGDIEGIVTALPLGSGFTTGRGILSYECDTIACVSGHFELTEMVDKGIYVHHKQLASFELDMCESIVVEWPTIWCDTCTSTSKIRLIGYKHEPQLGFFAQESVAILDLIE